MIEHEDGIFVFLPSLYNQRPSMYDDAIFSWVRAVLPPDRTQIDSDSDSDDWDSDDDVEINVRVYSLMR